ncbi:hypothetical protein CL6EHI_101130 [Entamoeba histolytica]|nr:hypothetical protein CL6EHI_101130 [Entamoeba histolytica]
MQREVPPEIIQLLDGIKLQNGKIFEMQEEQVQWNKQHAINLKSILDKINEMYQIIRDFKETKRKSIQPNNTIHPSLTTTLTPKSNNKQLEINTHEGSAKKKSSNPLINKLSHNNTVKNQENTQRTNALQSLVDLQDNLRKRTKELSKTPTKRLEIEDVPNQKKSRLNYSISSNVNNILKLEEVLMSIDSEEVFDQITEENIKKMIPCIVNIFIVGDDIQKEFVALEFVWEITRKHERIFEGTEGVVLANKLLHSLQLFYSTPNIQRDDCPLNSDEMKWLFEFFMHYSN